MNEGSSGVECMSHHMVGTLICRKKRYAFSSVVKIAFLSAVHFLASWGNFFNWKIKIRWEINFNHKIIEIAAVFWWKITISPLYCLMTKQKLIGVKEKKKAHPFLFFLLETGVMVLKGSLCERFRQKNFSKKMTKKNRRYVSSFNQSWTAY